MRKLYIGNSLSACVQDILRGRMELEQVACILAATKFDSPEVAFDSHWHTGPELRIKYSDREEEVRALYKNLWPRIVQLRLVGVDPNIAGQERWIEANIRDMNQISDEERADYA